MYFNAQRKKKFLNMFLLSTSSDELISSIALFGTQVGEIVYFIDFFMVPAWVSWVTVR